MANEREEMIGFLLSRLDTRDKLITQLQQQIAAGQQAASEIITEHSSTMANKAAQ